MLPKLVKWYSLHLESESWLPVSQTICPVFRCYFKSRTIHDSRALRIPDFGSPIHFTDKVRLEKIYCPNQCGTGHYKDKTHTWLFECIVKAFHTQCNLFAFSRLGFFIHCLPWLKIAWKAEKYFLLTKVSSVKWCQNLKTQA